MSHLPASTYRPYPKSRFSFWHLPALLLLSGLLFWVNPADAQPRKNGGTSVKELVPSSVLPRAEVEPYYTGQKNGTMPMNSDRLASTTLRLDSRVFTPEELKYATTVYQQMIPKDDLRTTRGRLNMRLDLALLHVASKRAAVEGLLEDAEFQRQLELSRARLTMQYYIENRLLRDITISEAEIVDYYQENLAKFQKPELVTFQIIVTEDREAGLLATAELDAGTSFRDAAEKFSIHASRLSGGKLSPVARGNLNEEVEEQAFALADGERSGIIETKAGYYIVGRIETQPAKVITQDEARPIIFQEMYEKRRSQKLLEYYRSLLKDAEIDLLAPLAQNLDDTASATQPASQPDEEAVKAETSAEKESTAQATTAQAADAE